ncbi:MAG: F0F1 ATP synthase subunit B [Gemmatimonadetes bacterium]|nr:F0F1 ATP synthase subunit B [Gemmatimonadota bacterium]
MNLLYVILQEHGGETPNVFNLTSNVAFWTLIIFAVLMVVLAKYAFPPILGYAAAREQRIQQALDDARRQREETEELLAMQREELTQARVQSQQLLQEGRQAAERVRQELLQQARAEGDELIDRTRHEIERQRVQAIESLRREAAELAIAAASRLLRERLDSAEDRRLVTEYLSGIESAAPGAGAS